MNKPFTRPRTGPMRFPGDMPNEQGAYATKADISEWDGLEESWPNPLECPQVAILAEDLRPLLNACRAIYASGPRNMPEAQAALLAEADRIERGIK